MTGRVDADPRVVRTRHAVLTAALDIAAKEGFADATVEAIAAESGVSKSTIYRHWPNIESIFLDALVSNKPPDNHVDLGYVRDDLVHHTTAFARVLTQQRIGQLLPHLISAAARDPNFARAHATYTATGREASMALLQRALERGDLPSDTDLEWLQIQIYAPILVRFLITHVPIDEQWGTARTNRTLTLAGTHPRATDHQ